MTFWQLTCRILCFPLCSNATSQTDTPPGSTPAHGRCLGMLGLHTAHRTATSPSSSSPWAARPAPPAGGRTSGPQWSCLHAIWACAEHSIWTCSACRCCMCTVLCYNNWDSTTTACCLPDVAIVHSVWKSATPTSSKQVARHLYQSMRLQLLQMQSMLPPNALTCAGVAVEAAAVVAGVEGHTPLLVERHLSQGVEA